MHILHVASELAPLAKVGGLADVVLGLTRALNKEGHKGEVILPKYSSLDTSQITDLHIEFRELWTYHDGRWHPNTVWAGKVEGILVYFIEAHNDTHFFDRERLYGYEDDTARFLYFSRAVLEFLLKSGLTPDVLHLHDWQTAAIAPLYKDLYCDLGLTHPKILFTIHNIEYQGWTHIEELGKAGLHGPSYLKPQRLQDNHHSTTINLMKGGIIYSDHTTTVSPNYAKEIKTPEGGRGLNTTLSEYDYKFTGVLNGLDWDYWNPETDPYLYTPFSWKKAAPKSKTPSFDKKQINKKILRERLMLEDEQSPIVSCVSRLVPQKGIELIKYALFRTLEKGGQFILLGSSPIESIQEEFHGLKQRFAQNRHVHFELNYNEELAHLIYGGSDMLIVPSIFEPCGLTQLIALRYGTLPIVRSTGGLADTVFDVDYSPLPMEERNGFVFEHPDCQGVDSALLRALHYWFKKPETWEALTLRSMQMDHSWGPSCAAYIQLYENITKKSR